jgi:probable rRNA maturation factor
MVEINNLTKQKINSTKTVKLVEEFLRVYKKSSAEVSIAIVGAERMRRLNNNYRGTDKTTDVLSFGEKEEKNNRNIKKSGAGNYLGEVVINITETKKASKYLEVFGVTKSADYIFYFLLIHGLLHLIGYEDEKEIDRQNMLALGTKFLKNNL